jgi:hypothetical protein
MIIAFIITFIVVGLIMGFVLNENIAIIGIVIISVLWAFVMGPWAIATLIELSLGYAIAKKIKS